MDRKANLGYHLWGLLVLFLWMREWKVEMPVKEAAAFPASFELVEATGSY